MSKEEARKYLEKMGCERAPAYIVIGKITYPRTFDGMRDDGLDPDCILVLVGGETSYKLIQNREVLDYDPVPGTNKFKIEGRIINVLDYGKYKQKHYAKSNETEIDCYLEDLYIPRSELTNPVKSTCNPLNKI